MASTHLTIWQWNCRGFRKKKAHLQLLVQETQLPNCQTPPDVIALQETMASVSLPGYIAFQQFTDSHNQEAPSTGTLVHKSLTAKQHDLEFSDIPHTVVEILPRKRSHQSVFILNVYCAPRARADDFNLLFQKTTSLSRGAQLLILGDFNARHPDWGYLQANKRGKKLWQLGQDLRLTLLNDLQQSPTRIGNSVCRDTSPDLTYCKNIAQARWENTCQLAGSDHYIIAIQVQTSAGKRVHNALAQITEWPKFRDIRESEAPERITNLKEWTASLNDHVRRTTRESKAAEETPATDSRLLHMWDAHASLLRRWQKQRYNKKLRRRIQALSEEIERHSTYLARQQWGQLCSGLNGQLGNKKTWHLLRHLLDPDDSKTAARHRLKRLVHQHPGSDEDLLIELADKYINQAHQPATPLPPYEGKPNPTLDADITEAEVYAAILKLRTTSAPGPDGVSNKTIRNLDARSVTALTEYFNDCWHAGNIPEEWKHAKIVFIPKPGKKADLSNLRPISLTSCLGKLFEHVVLARLETLAEEQDLFPPTMLGFRAHLSTQDALVQIYHDLLKDPVRAGTRAMLGIDLRKAFDNVTHEAIAQHLASTNPGERIYNYVCSFLQGRTVELSLIDSNATKRLALSNKGTPQGAVLSPFLFNLVMSQLPQLLDCIPNIRHTLYADDVTVWTTTGSDGQIEEALQRAVDTVAGYVACAGLECSVEKSELLLLRPPDYRKVKHPPLPTITLRMAGSEIPIVQHMRVLGLHVQAGRGNTVALERLAVTVTQTARLLGRISARKHGMKEKELLQLLNAFVTTRITYALPYLRLLQAEKEKVDRLIRTVHKIALGLSRTTSTMHLLSLGIHNTIDELIEAHRTAQIERLRGSKTGRWILQRIGIPSSPSGQDLISLPPLLRQRFIVQPLPKNMLAGIHDGRRSARARNLHNTYGTNTKVAHVDAASYPTPKQAFAINVSSKRTPVDIEPTTRCAGSIRTQDPTEAEEAAIALAAMAGFETIISDSKSAIIRFARGTVSPTTARILRPLPRAARNASGDTTASSTDDDDPRLIQLIWVPAHAGNPGNEAAHRQARGLVCRAVGQTSDHDIEATEALITFHDITQYYKLSRQTRPTPQLNKAQQITWRRLQTNSFPSPYIYRHIYPALFTSTCTLCKTQTATLDHIIWGCSKDPPPPNLLGQSPSSEAWERILTTTSLDTQLRAIKRADEVATRHGLTALAT